MTITATIARATQRAAPTGQKTKATILAEARTERYEMSLNASFQASTKHIPAMRYKAPMNRKQNNRPTSITYQPSAAW